MTQIVPLQPVPNQTEQIILNGQNCQIEVFQTNDALFLNLYVNDNPVIEGVICENLNLIVRNLYLGFEGDLAFSDMQGTSDPNYTGLGSRYQLIYYSSSEVSET